jgi:hypothetical protein
MLRRDGDELMNNNLTARSCHDVCTAVYTSFMGSQFTVWPEQEQ